MKSTQQGWQKPPQPLLHNHLDSRRWEHIESKKGDVIISTYPKSGTTRETTTWLQLLHGGIERLATADLAFYVEVPLMSINEIVERVRAQKHRRIFRSHLPLEHLPYHSGITYVDVWRHPLDVAVSFFHHHNKANQVMFEGINTNRPEGTEEFLPNTLSIADWVDRWVHQDGYPYFSYVDHVQSWWRYKDLPNVHIFHFSDLEKNGLEVEIRKRAQIAGVELTGEQLERIARLCSFESMKKNSETTAPYGGVVWGQGKGKEFFRKGISGDHKNHLTPKKVFEYSEYFKGVLEKGCYDFLFQ